MERVSINCIRPIDFWDIKMKASEAKAITKAALSKKANRLLIFCEEKIKKKAALGISKCYVRIHNDELELMSYVRSELEHLGFIVEPHLSSGIYISWEK
jgi:hypothetical protein